MSKLCSEPQLFPRLVSCCQLGSSFHSVVFLLLHTQRFGLDKITKKNHRASALPECVTLKYSYRQERFFCFSPLVPAQEGKPRKLSQWVRPRPIVLRHWRHYGSTVGTAVLLESVCLSDPTWLPQCYSFFKGMFLVVMTSPHTDP